MATVPSAPSEAAGNISASADWNAWATATSYLLGSGAGKCPMFWLLMSAAQTFTTSAAAVTWAGATTAPIYKDNDGGWSSGSPTKYTIQTKGYWTVDYTVNAGTSASNLLTYVQVTTTSSNLINPSVTLKFAYNNQAASSANACNCSSSLVPILLYPNDSLQVFAQTGASSTSGGNPSSSFTGQWVSA